ELRMNGVPPDALAGLAPVGPDASALAERVARELDDAALADRATIFATATAAAADASPHPVGLPLLLLDVPLANAGQAALVATVARAAPDVLATVPAGGGAAGVRSAEGRRRGPDDASRRRDSTSRD